MTLVRTDLHIISTSNTDVFNVPFWYELKDRGRLY